MKLHTNVLLGILECLHQVFIENKYTEDVLDKAFRQHPQWGSRDRRFVAECSFEVVRWWRLFLVYADSEPSQPDAFHKVLAVYLLRLQMTVPGWLIQDPDFSVRVAERVKLHYDRSMIEAIPDWLDDIGKTQLGEDRWEKELRALNTPAKVFLRVNTGKVTREHLQQLLLSKQIETSLVMDHKDALVLKTRQNLVHLQEYINGYFEIQDVGSQQIAPFLQAKAGETVIDACAGGGGKTLHLASLMNGKGEIWALDVEEKKLNNLKVRTKRAGVTIVNTSVINEQFLTSHIKYADKILLDVPCSGLGVLKRHPDTKWKLSAASIQSTVEVQAKILQQYTEMLKVGGEVVYATCSILPSENNDQIARFIKLQRGTYSLMEEQTIWPSEGADGYYMARLRKNS